MAGGYSTVVAGTNIAASTHNEFVRDQVVSQFASTSARDSAITGPVEGMLCATRDTDQLWMYAGAAWVPIGWYSSTGRVGVTLARAANQSISNNTLTAISWDTETSDAQGFITATSTTLTVPAGYGGVYGVHFTATGGGTSGCDIMELLLNASAIDSAAGNVGAPTKSVSWAGLVLAAADTLQFKIRHQIGSPQNFTAALTMYRTGL